MSAKDLHIDTLVLGPLETNCYLLRSGGDCWVVDPAWPGVLRERLRRASLAPGRILLTHAHADHIAGAAELKEAWPDCRLCCPAGDAGLLQDPAGNLSALLLFPLEIPPADELLRPGQTLELGATRWEVLDTSGHTPGGVSYHCPEAGVVLTGDSLFAGGIGRTDMPGGDALLLIENIRRRLLALPDGTKVLAGHGPASTIGEERHGNPFLAGE
jgi:hydroxyacylglutathione hydrolase